MSTIASNINKKTNSHQTTHSHKTNKDSNVFLEIAEVISFWAVAATTILLISIATWA